MAKDYLKSLKVDFEDIDVSSNEQAAQEMIKISGQMGVPVIVIDKKIIIGFPKEEIDKALEK
jgi:glutaredoxin 3